MLQSRGAECLQQVGRLSVAKHVGRDNHEMRNSRCPASVPCRLTGHAGRQEEGIVMNHNILCVLVLVWLGAGPAMAQGQSLGSERTLISGPSDSPDATRRPRSSWESWLNHGEPHRTAESHLSPGGPDLAAPTGLHAPSIAPASELLGPETGRIPSERRSNRNAERVEAVPGGERR